jgi:uncharacterized protein (TIGR00156 family)
MKKNLFVSAALFAAIALTPLFAQEGFTGPRSDQGGRNDSKNVTVTEAVKLRDDTRVVLQGTIVSALRKEKYLFRDSTGEITIEIDDDVWRGLSISENDKVEIYGKIEKEKHRIEIDVKRIRKL